MHEHTKSRKFLEITQIHLIFKQKYSENKKIKVALPHHFLKKTVPEKHIIDFFSPSCANSLSEERITILCRNPGVTSVYLLCQITLNTCFFINFDIFSGEPKYHDPACGAPPSFSQRIAEIGALESDTVRWERARKLKKKIKGDG